jgi:hypothetical protein
VDVTAPRSHEVYYGVRTEVIKSLSEKSKNLVSLLFLVSLVSLNKNPNIFRISVAQNFTIQLILSRKNIMSLCLCNNLLIT